MSLAENQQNVARAGLAEHDAEATAKSHEDLVARIQDAKKALEMSIATFKPEYLEWAKQSNAMVQETRQTRMSLDSEIAMILTRMRDVRKFFLEKDHADEMARLREFVDTVERLQALYECGFLEKVSNIMLKMEGLQ